MFATTPKTRLPARNLDVMRAIAVTAVVACHALQAVGPQSLSAFDAWLGHAGVLIFFVHTSLVLMSSLERQGDRPDWIRAFLIRRAFRIYPLAWVAIALALLTGWSELYASAGGVHLTRVDTVSNVLLVQNIVNGKNAARILWSLPIEMQMYLALPFCYLVARRGAVAGFVLLAGSVMLGILYQMDGIPQLWRLSVLNYGPCFVAGVMAYALLRQPHRARLPGWAWIVAPCALIAAGAVMPTAEWSGWLLCACLGLSIPYFVELEQGRLTETAETVCRYSYGAYLFHVTAIHFAVISAGAFPVPVRLIVFLVAVVALPWIVFHVVEAPGIRLGQRLVQKRASSDRSSAAATTPAP